MVVAVAVAGRGRGRAGAVHEVTNPLEVRHLDALGLDVWAAHEKSHWLRIGVWALTGRRIVEDHVEAGDPSGAAPSGPAGRFVEHERSRPSGLRFADGENRWSSRYERIAAVRTRAPGSLAAVAALVAAVGLAACGSVVWDHTKVESAIKSVLTKQADVRVQSVSCPQKAKIAKGVVTYCEASIAGGYTVRFSATQLDSNGHVHVGPAEMITPEVQDNIRASLRARGITATVACPQHEPIVVGKTFVCTARDKQGESARIGVTITDAGAGFKTRILSS
jgi:hypothetical protein